MYREQCGLMIMMTMDGGGCEIADADNAVDDMICLLVHANVNSWVGLRIN